MRIRAERMALQMQRDISEIVRSQVKDPRVGFLTVTGVEVSNDLTHVKVFISVFGDAEEKRATMETLERAKGFIRTEVGRRIRLRLTPEIHFRLDESADYGEKIERVLRDLSPRAKEAVDGHGPDPV